MGRKEQVKGERDMDEGQQRGRGFIVCTVTRHGESRR